MLPSLRSTVATVPGLLGNAARTLLQRYEPAQHNTQLSSQRVVVTQHRGLDPTIWDHNRSDINDCVDTNAQSLTISNVAGDTASQGTLGNDVTRGDSIASSGNTPLSSKHLVVNVDVMPCPTCVLNYLLGNV